MTEVASVRPVAAVVLPLATMAVVVAAAGRPRVRDWTPPVAALGTASLVYSMVPAARAGTPLATDIGPFVPGVSFVLRADPLGLLFAVVASTLWFTTAVYDVGYARETGMGDRTRYLAALCLAVGAAVGVAFASNLLVLLVFYELTTIGTYPLVAHAGTDRARRVGFEYAAYVLAGGTAAVGGTVGVFLLAGTLTFEPGGIVALTEAAEGRRVVATGSLVLLLVGFGVKAAILPVHGWLPDAMVAPTPVSGVLHAVVVVKSGVFGVARTVLETFGPETTAALGVSGVLAALAAATILAGGLLALHQDDLKARLAYSTIAHLSYVVFGIALLVPGTVIGGLVHIPAHATAKLTLFFCVGALYARADVKRVSEVAGVGRRMPITMGAFAVAACSLAGIPLLAGFVSKWQLLVGASGIHPLVPAVLVVSGVLNVAYLWPIVHAGFFETPDDADPKPIVEGPLGGRSASGDARIGSDATTRTEGGAATRTEDSAATRTGGGPAAPAEGTGGPASSSDANPTWSVGPLRPTLVVPPLFTTVLVVLVGIIPEATYVLEAARVVAEASLGAFLPVIHT